ncbi:MAG: hypothetical protein RL713_1259 [Bacteroidota bacterium]
MIGMGILSRHIARTYIKGILCLSIFLSALNESIAQQKRAKSEEINITSSFKPSIVKTGKLEFFPEIPTKDTHSYRFNYAFDPVIFKTPLSAFSLKPLAYQVPPSPIDVNNLYLKLGGGNLNTPFVSAAYQTRIDKNLLSFGADHISSKGRMPNQQYANTALTGRFSRQVADNQSFTLNLGYHGDAYRNYGYDTAKFSFSEDELKQKFNLFSFGAGYDLVAGADANLFIKPRLKLDYLTTRRDAKEMNLQLAIPVDYVVGDDIKLTAPLNIDYVNLKENPFINNSLFLLQLPLKVDYIIDGLYASGGIIPVLKNNKLVLAPDAKLVYTFKDGAAVRLLGGISNTFNINSLKKLYEINPFLLTPAELTVFQQTNYYVGFDWLNAKGLQLQAKMGFVKFKNLPLFTNSSNNLQIPSGKDFAVMNEESATAFFVESNLGYIFSDKLSFNAALKAYSFQSQLTYDDPYGILPIDLNLDFKWRPIDPLGLKLNGQIFGGNMAMEAGSLPFRTKGILDLGFAVDYKLNKKWALWIDLNNIANAKYQRWNGYTSFGFNFLLGVKFNFTQLAQ